jgi:hypothetical protein
MEFVYVFAESLELLFPVGLGGMVSHVRSGSHLLGAQGHARVDLLMLVGDMMLKRVDHRWGLYPVQVTVMPRDKHRYPSVFL